MQFSFLIHSVWDKIAKIAIYGCVIDDSQPRDHQWPGFTIVKQQWSENFCDSFWVAL